MRRTARRLTTKTLSEYAKNLKNRYGSNGFTFTVSRRLAERGLKRRVALKRPALTFDQKRRRLHLNSRYRTFL